MITIALASTAYTTFALLDITHDQERLPLFRIAVALYAIIMIYYETVSLQAYRHSTTLPYLAYIAILGYITILATACFTPSFIQDSSYLIGFFLVTLSVLTQVLLQVATSVKKGQCRYSSSFLRLISTAGVGYCLFANATVKAFDGHNMPGMSQIGEYGMAMGIVLHWSIAYFNRKEEKELSGKGLYSSLESSKKQSINCFYI